MRRDVSKLARRVMQEWTTNQLSDVKPGVASKRIREAKPAPALDAATLQKFLASAQFPAAWKAAVLECMPNDKVRM